MHKIYLLLGSNMGAPSAMIEHSRKHIEKEIGNIIRESSLYRTAAWGNTDQPDFLNQVIVVQSKLTANEVMESILHIENKMGRIRTVKNAPRIIDIDILFYDREIITNASLTVPHPAIPDRRFVLVPLNELSPGFIHPVLKRSMHVLLEECNDNLDVKKN